LRVADLLLIVDSIRIQSALIHNPQSIRNPQSAMSTLSP
jgi:hypothetical protein